LTSTTNIQRIVFKQITFFTGQVTIENFTELLNGMFSVSKDAFPIHNTNKESEQ